MKARLLYPHPVRVSPAPPNHREAKSRGPISLLYATLFQPSLSSLLRKCAQCHCELSLSPHLPDLVAPVSTSSPSLRTHLRNPRPARRVASCFATSRHGPGPGGRCGALAPAAPRRGRRPSCGGHLRRHGEEQRRPRGRRRRSEEAEGDPSVRGRLVPDRLHFRRRRSGFGRFSLSLVLIRVPLGLLGPMGLQGGNWKVSRANCSIII